MSLEILGKTMLHNLWQGVLIFVVIRVALKRVKNPNYRVPLLSGAMFLLLVISMVSFAILSSASDHSNSYTYTDRNNYESVDVVTLTPEMEVIENQNRTFYVQNEPTKFQVSRSPLSILGLLWLSGAFLFLIRLLTLHTITNSMFKSSEPILENRIKQCVDEIKQKTNWGDIPILLHRDIFTPCVKGVFRYTIILPLALINNINEDELKAILAHEIAHIEYRDGLFKILESIVHALLFFNPVLWWLSNQLTKEREFRADKRASEVLGDSEIYAEALYSWGCKKQELALTGFASDESTLKRRISKILGLKEKKDQRAKFLSLFAILLVLLSLLIIGCTTIKTGVDALHHSNSVKQTEDFVANSDLHGVFDISIKILNPDGIEEIGDSQNTIVVSQNINGHESSTSEDLPLNLSTNGNFTYWNRFDGYNQIYYSLYPKKGAPYFSPIFPLEDEITTINEEIVLQKGKEIQLNITSTDGIIVPNAKLSYSLWPINRDTFSSIVNELETDENGIITFYQAKNHEYRITGTIKAKGFRDFELSGPIDSYESINLEPVKIYKTKLIDGETGKVLVNHNLEIIDLNDIYSSKPIKTDNQGYFEYSLMENDTELYLSTETESGTRGFFSVGSKHNGGSINFLPTTMDLKIKCNDEHLEKLNYSLTTFNKDRTSGTCKYFELDDLNFTKDEDVYLHYKLPIMFPADELSIEYDDQIIHQVELPLESSNSTIEYDLTSNFYNLEIDIISPEGFTPANGSVLTTANYDSVFGAERVIDIIDGKGHGVIFSVDKVVTIECIDLNNYIFPIMELEVLEKNSSVSIKVEPAGTIHGALEYKGNKSYPNVHISLEHEPVDERFMHSYGGVQESFRNGKYSFTSLVLDSKYTLTASYGYSKPITTTFKLEEDSLVLEKNLTFKKYPDLQIKLVDANSNLLEIDSVDIRTKFKDSRQHSHSFTNSTMTLENFDAGYIKEMVLTTEYKDKSYEFDLKKYNLKKNILTLVVD